MSPPRASTLPGLRSSPISSRPRESRGATVVLASHVASDLIEHCDRLALLVGGEVQRVGPPDELLGDRDVLQLRVRGLSEEAAAALEDRIRDLGGELLDAGPAHRSLQELYRTIEPKVKRGVER